MLETYGSFPQAEGRRRALALASVAAHVLLGVSLFLYSLLHIEEIAPPVVALTFLSAAPPPPPPPPPPASSKSSSKTTPKVEVKTEAKIVQPTETPKQETKKEEPAGEVGGVEGGVKGGVAGGVVGGVVGGQLGGTGVPGKMVPSFTLVAQQIAHPEPRLPEWFLQQHATQTIKGTYKVCIQQDGRIGEVTTMVGIPGVDDVIVSQIKSGWVYKPQPVPVCTAAVIIYKIK